MADRPTRFRLVQRRTDGGRIDRAGTSRGLHDGREVAVKIQYPGAAEAIRADLANHEMVTKFVRFVSSASGATMPDLRTATREMIARIAEEIDYRHEAANITAFGDFTAAIHSSSSPSRR